MPRTLDDLELEPNERAALKELRARLRERFGDRLVKLVLFGSRIRGGRTSRTKQADPDSLAVEGCVIGAVIRHFNRQVPMTGEEDAVSALRAEIDLQFGVFLQLLAYSESEYNERLEHQWPLFVDMESEGIALHGSVSGRREPTTPANRRLQARMLMERARRSLRSAESMFSVPDLHTAASSEACAAVLRAAEAVLAAKGVERSRSGVRSRGLTGTFQQRVVKAGEMHARFAKLLHEARLRRAACTYDVTHEETKEGAASMLGNARAFLAAVEKRLKVEIEKLKS